MSTVTEDVSGAARLGANQEFIMNRPPYECNRCRLGI